VAAILKPGDPYTMEKVRLADFGCSGVKKVICEVKIIPLSAGIYLKFTSKGSRSSALQAGCMS
jgi:hypothetical protein